MADEKLTAATRIEKLLDNIAGGDNDVTPATRLEKFLSYIADAMEGGGGSGGGGGVSIATIDVLPEDFPFPQGYIGGFYIDITPEDLMTKSYVFRMNDERTGYHYTNYFTARGEEMQNLMLDPDFVDTYLSSITGIPFNPNSGGAEYNGYYIALMPTS